MEISPCSFRVDLTLLIAGCVAIPTKNEPAAYTQALVQDAIRFYNQEGRQAAIDHFSSPENVDGPWYVVIISEDGYTIAHFNPDIKGRNPALRVDSTGYFFGDAMLSALNCNGNLLDPHPTRGQASQDVFFRTVELAHRLGLDTVVTMSGCPGDPSGTPYPNWPTHPQQPEYADLERWQWDEIITPFWENAGRFAADRGVRVAIELHPGQSAYNTRTMLRLRAIAGPSVGVNLDPSHFFYQGMDPLIVIPALGEGFIFHVHAKDTRINPSEMALNGGLDMRPMDLVAERSWAYRTLGYGHGEAWWRDFVSALRLAGYDGALSIEHEDPVMSASEGIIKSVQFLEPLILRTMPE